MTGISIITCTGGRPEAFFLCQRWMAAQTFSGDMQWIVADDVDPATELELGQESIRPFPRWQPGENTLPRNLAAALSRVKYDRVLFVEDDDHYAPSYLQSMHDAFERAPLIGQSPARYYNVRWRRYTVFRSVAHASLCQTGIRAELFPVLLCESRSKQGIDMRLWRATRGRNFLFDAAEVVGIKGLPGRPGIGVGHHPNNAWSHDESTSVLRHWIGQDADFYLKYFAA